MPSDFLGDGHEQQVTHFCAGCEQLTRERDEARAACDEARDAHCRVRKERDELRAKLDILAEWATRPMR